MNTPKGHYTLNRKDIQHIERNAYYRGLRMGIFIAIILSTITFYVMNQYLQDEVKATNYYYNLTKTK